MDDKWTTQDRAKDLGEQLDISPDTYKGHEGPALNIMSRLAALQYIPDHDKRRQAANEILAYSNRIFPANDPDTAAFNRKVQETAITQQELPMFTNELSYPNDKLVDRYINTDRAVKALGYAGIGGGLDAGKDAVKGGIKGSQEDAGTLAKRAGNTLRGAGSEVGSSVKGLAGPLKGGPGVVYWGMGTAGYYGLSDYRRKLEIEIHKRYKEGKLPLKLYQKAFGADAAVDPQYGK